MFVYGNNTVMCQISVVQNLNMIIPTQMDFEWAEIHHRRLILYMCILLNAGSDFEPNML